MADRSSIEWWRGAVIYQVYPRSFQDTNGDGIGDLAGITQRLDHIASLGVDAVWISPFFKSPMADYGYDVEDYRAVDPMFGSLGDFDHLLEKAHKLGLKLLVDLVPCHTSDRHHWFQEARQSRDNVKADWYVFAEPKEDGTPPNNWLSIFGGVAWTFEPRRGQYYLHNFLPSQPQLNWHNPAVRDAFLAEAEFWLERGVDGFRVDAIDFALHDPELKNNPVRPRDSATVGGFVPGMPFSRQIHLGQKNHPALPEKVLRPLKALAERYDAFLIGEMSGDRSAERLAAYTDGGGLDAAYTFELLRSTADPTSISRVSDDVECHIGAGWASYSMSNHDVTRASSRFGPHDQAEAFQPLLTAILCSLRGTICLYQGEELGLTEAELAFEDLRDPYGINFFPAFKGRDGCRTPMPWRGHEQNAGFTTGKPWLPVPISHQALAVDRQEGDPHSVLNRTRRFLHWRQNQPALLTGDIRILEDKAPILALVRKNGDQRLLCVFNLSAGTAVFEAPEPIQIDAGSDFEARFDDQTITLEAYGAFFGSMNA
ncbi:MAG: alpha-glucosidase family protein [Pseudomonadota bacterium]